MRQKMICDYIYGTVSADGVWNGWASVSCRLCGTMLKDFMGQTTVPYNNIG